MISQSPKLARNTFKDDRLSLPQVVGSNRERSLPSNSNESVYLQTPAHSNSGVLGL